MQPLQELANRHNVAVLVVHHMNRSDANDIYDLINGTTGIGGSVDTLLGLQYERGKDEATLAISSREIEDDTPLALRWDSATAQWILLGKAAEVRLSRERQAIINVLREENRPMGPKEVAEALGRTVEGDYANVKQLMYRMSKEGDLHSIDRGKYTLPALSLLEPPATTGLNQQGSQGNPGDLTADHLPLGVRKT